MVVSGNGFTVVLLLFMFQIFVLGFRELYFLFKYMYSRHRLIRRPQNTEILPQFSDMMN